MSSPTVARPTEYRQSTPAWVDARQDFIGSSDLPVITGNTPYGTSIFSLWAIKTRLVPPEPIDPDMQELFDLGHALEDDIAERYTVKTDRRVRRANLMLARKDTPWASASIDRLSAVKGERRIVECKWVPHRSWINDGPEPVPAAVQDQVQWQLWVTGYDVADVAVLLGSKVYVYEIGPIDSYQADLAYIARCFRDLVTRGVPPPVDGSEATRKALTRLHPSVVAPDILPPTLESDALAAEWLVARREAKAATENEGRLANAMRSFIGDHQGVEGDTYRVTWTKNADTTKTDWQAVAKGYRRVLEAIAAGEVRDGSRIDIQAIGDDELAVIGGLSLGDELIDAIQSLHTKAVEGPRVLRARFKDESTGKWV